MSIVKIIIETIDKGSGGVKKLDANFKDMMATAGKLAGAVGIVGVALKKTFDLSKEGANIKQLGSSFDYLNENILHTPNLLNDMRAASRGTIADFDLMQGVLKLTAGASNEASQAFAQAAPQLLEIAKASNKLNPTLGDTAFLYESITTGIKRGSPLILDNLGIVIKVEEANQKYAQSLGKTVAALTSEEKQMAILNATLESGGQLINQVGGDVASQADNWARLEVQVETFFTTFKTGLADTLVPAIATVSNLATEYDTAIDSMIAKNLEAATTQEQVVAETLKMADSLNTANTIFGDVTGTAENIQRPLQDVVASFVDLSLVGKTAANGHEAVYQSLQKVYGSAVTMERGYVKLNGEVVAYAGLLIDLKEQQDLMTLANQAGVADQAMLNSAILETKEVITFTTDALSNYLSLESMYGRQGEASGQSAVNSWRARNEALAAYGETLANGTGIESQYAAAAMESTAGTNALADSLFRAANAAAAEQAALLGTFNALAGNEEALADYAVIMEGVQTHSVLVSGATDEQKAALEDLQSEYEKAQETITSYQIGVKGVGLSEDERNEKIAEQRELMGQLSAAMEPLSAIQSEYATYTDGGAQATQLLNEKLFGQIQASSDSAAAIALAGVALGVYTEAEANAMLKSALLEEMIRKQAEAWDGTAAGLATIQTNIEGYIGVLNGIPDVINTTVSTDYQSTGTPPPWAGGPSSGDTGENEGSWGGEAMASGGVVTGGVWGRDSVPAMLMPGEEVLPVNDPRNIRNGGGASNSVVVNVYGAMGANPQAIAGAVTRAITPRG